MAQAAPRSRRAFAAIAVVLLHAAIVAVFIGSLRFSREAEIDFVPLSLTFYPEPPPPIPYAPQARVAPMTAPRLNLYAPLPDLVVPFVPPQGNAITLPQQGGAVLQALGRMLNCRYETYETLAENKDCIADLATADSTALYVPTAEEAERNAGFARAFAARHSPILVPCVAGLMVSFICLANRIANGFSRGAAGLPTYADLE